MVCCAFAHKKQRPFRLTLIFVMLSIAVASVAAAIIFIPGIRTCFTFTIADFIYYGIIFVVGALCASFPKIFFPAVSVCYVGVCIITLVVMYRSFGLASDAVSVSVTQNQVCVDKQKYDLDVLPSQQVNILFVVYTLPDKLLVPLPRTWYLPAGAFTANEQMTSSEQIDDGRNNPFPSADMNSSKIKFFYQYIFSRPANSFVALPVSSVYPALYTVTSARKLTSVQFSAIRSF